MNTKKTTISLLAISLLLGSVTMHAADASNKDSLIQRVGSIFRPILRPLFRPTSQEVAMIQQAIIHSEVREAFNKTGLPTPVIWITLDYLNVFEHQRTFKTNVAWWLGQNEIANVEIVDDAVNVLYANNTSKIIDLHSGEVLFDGRANISRDLMRKMAVPAGSNAVDPSLVNDESTSKDGVWRVEVGGSPLTDADLIPYSFPPNFRKGYLFEGWSGRTKIELYQNQGKKLSQVLYPSLKNKAKAPDLQKLSTF